MQPYHWNCAKFPIRIVLKIYFLATKVIFPCYNLFVFVCRYLNSVAFGEDLF